MLLPYVIDNQVYKLTAILDEVMAARADHSLDVAFAYFSIGGFRLLQAQLQDLRSFRLIVRIPQMPGWSW